MDLIPSAAATPNPRILAASGVSASVTGTTAETTLATVTIPANTVAAGGRLRITTYWDMTGANGTRTTRVRYSGAAGTVYSSTAAGNTVLAGMYAADILFPTVSTQTGASQPALTTFFGTSTAVAAPTSTVDSTASTTIVISGQLANGLDTMTLKGYTVELITPV